MKFKLLYILLFVFGTCLGQKTELDLKNYFSKTEIKDLNLITDFFQEQICGTKDRGKFVECITKSLPELVDLENNYVRQKINYRNQKKLYSKISDSTFNKIWAICKTWREVDPKYEYQSICFSQNKLFIDFAKELGKSNKYLEYYAEKLQNIGAFDDGIFLASNIQKAPSNWNLENRNIQIMIAIHYLTQNDMLKRDRKAARLEKKDLRKLNRKK
ncbi:hypothetical protein [Cellulophaga sp. Hel_I_12]|uniref:hypothetical protein n=1 Tax=Cellulophaga sp. Hel_I_12 TaxID=1249972 RepID=UPI000648DE27|nr:hypothetical protein [Cellulophaga sp. Hel_I_12]